ncbi:citramalate synthase [Thermicanus aegyptius]|uniref:citramalate synthase n=1 Tax=Thermicanus aegyptius TaxID=94009 RepID=UPI000414C85E|nr:citramalate synthase [Thermicanus aegyptius]
MENQARLPQTTPPVFLYDTTLRDGAQSAGIHFTLQDKLRILKLLDSFGVHYIEGGWPGANPKDVAFFQEAKNVKLKNSQLVAFGSTCRVGLAPEEDPMLKGLLEAETEMITIFGKSWDLHVAHALHTTLDENLRIIEESIRFLKKKGRQVMYDAEHFFDGYRNNPDYALKTIEAAVSGGADWIILCDTNGGALPWEIEEIVSQVNRRLTTPLGVHLHNDGGMAVASSLTAVRAGARQVQGTVNGYGERCGNADLVPLIANLVLKMGIPVLEREKLQSLTHLSRSVSEIANRRLDEGHPFVGRNAFAHKAGVHVNALRKKRETYEHIPPEWVGNERRIVVSDQAGGSNILEQEALGDLDPQVAKILAGDVKRLEHEGYSFEEAEGSLELLLYAREGEEFPFTLESFRVTLEKRREEKALSEATIKLRVGDSVVHTAAEGNGPVNALDNALRKALTSFFPELESCRLTDYKVRVLEGSDGTGATVRVLIRTHDGENSWGTVGVSENIIEASWEALLASLSIPLMRKKRKSGKVEISAEKENAV